jgi:hypothetical protein
MSSTYLTRTPSSASDRKTWTWSAWVKRSSLSTGNQVLFVARDGGFPEKIQFNSSDQLEYDHDIAGTDYTVRSDMLFRDTSAWYHIVVAKDTTQSTETNRLLFYANGQGLATTEFQLGYPPQNYDGAINNTVIHTQGSDGTGYEYFDGSMSHINFVDGAALTPSAFGETDATTGEWKIKTSPSVTYGTNGFFILKDGNSVTDQSGEGNNFTVGGGTLTKTEDSPSNVFATWNPLVNNAGEMMRLTNGNTSCQSNAAEGNSWKLAVSTLGMTSGKYYWEAKLVNINNNNYHGVMGSNVFQANASLPMNATGFTGWNNSDGGEILKDGDNTANNYGTLADNDILGIACDVDNYTISVYKNGSALVSNYALSTTGRDILFPCSLAYNTNNTGIPQSSYNFGNGYFGTTAVASAGTNASGNGIFEYDVPTGFTALSTKGLNL